MRKARIGLVVLGAALVGGVAYGQAGPATDAKPAAPAATPRETGLTQAAAEESLKKAIPGIEFSQASTVDARRRVFGTVAKAKMPAIELMGPPEDLSQVTALTPLAPQGSADSLLFAAAVLDFGAADWEGRKDWLAAAIKKVEESKGDHQVVETRGRMRISFSAWQQLGMFRVTVETVDGAAFRAAQMGKSGIPLPTDVPGAAKPAPKPPAAAKATDGAKQFGAAPKVETKADGTMVVDSKYPLKGKGTEAEPYKVMWDQLVSAQDEYVPKDGRKEIPGRIGMLDGKWVEITGYIAFPLMVDTPDECLSMMNQWDGCCIGVPPTPYDAIEVRLTKAVEGNARMTTYGTVKGLFKVDPHLVGGWLVGLYAMDRAVLTPQTYGGFAP